MLKFRISETSGRIPVVLLILELAVFHAAVLLAAYLEFFSSTDFHATAPAVWVLRATVVSGVAIMCMAVLRLYQGRPRERTGVALLRLAASFAFAAGVLQLLYMALPLLRIEAAVLTVSLVLAFFFLGTARPVFLDSITEQRERVRDAVVSASAEDDSDDQVMSREEFRARLERNDGKTSLTAQHRITRRGI